MTKPIRLQGTCYNGTHWLNKEDCNSCSLKKQCIKLNTTPIISTPVNMFVPEKVVLKHKRGTLGTAIIDALLTGGHYQQIVSSIVDKTQERKEKVMSLLKGIGKSIHEQKGKWSKYQDISDVNGHLQIKLR